MSSETSTDSRRERRVLLVRLLWPLRLRLLLVGFLSLAGGAMEALVLVVVVQAAKALAAGQSAVDVSFGVATLSGVSIGPLLAAAFSMTLLRVALQLVAAWISARVATGVQHRVRIGLFRDFSNARWDLQSTEREGRLQQLDGPEAERVTRLVVQVAQMLTTSLNLAVLILSAVVVSPLGAGALLLAVGVLYAAFRPFTRHGRRHATNRSEAEFALAETLNEAARTAEEVKLFGVGRAQERIIAEQVRPVERATSKLLFMNQATVYLYHGVVILLLITGLAVLLQFDDLDVAVLGAVILIFLRSFAYAQQAQAAVQAINEYLPSLRLVERQRREYREARWSDGGAALPSIDEIELRDVGYDYSTSRPALSGVTFRVRRGEIVGITGPSGAGKSTLTQILLRLRVPTSGEYFVNGQSAMEYSESDWCALVAYLPQDTKLIGGTVNENIAFLREGLEDAQLRTAAQEAFIDDEVRILPQAYGTLIGQRANAVSGGQRQRLCLARALVTDPQLLVLDEPTSALDYRSEQLIQRSLESRRGRSTVFIVSHRTSILEICDRVLVVRDGQVEAPSTAEAPDGGPLARADNHGGEAEAVQAVGTPAQLDRRRPR